MPIQEILQQIITYLRGIWRYRWVAMALVWIVAITGWVVVAKMPNQYKATARIHVDTASLLRPLLRGLATRPDVGYRLQLMTRTLLSRPNLEKIARMTDLDIRAETPKEMESLLDTMAKKIKFGRTRRENLYTISYEDNDPEVAKEIVQALLTIFMESTLGETRQDSDSAQKFLIQQIAEHEARLREAENLIKEFKRKNIGNMPSAGRDYFQRLQSAQGELTQARLLLKEATNRRNELQRQIEGEEPVFGFGGSSSSSQAANPIEARIQNLRVRLDELRLQYTDQHPEVIAAKNTIELLEKKKKEALAGAPSESGTVSRELEQNPVYQQLRISLGQAEASVASLSARVEEYEKRVQELKRRVNTILEVEAELKGLNRNYGLIKKNYDALVSSLESARMGEQVEEAGDDVKFKVIDPPRVPLTPSGPNRVMLSTAVLIAAMAAGLALAFLLSQIRPAIYDRRTLQKITGLPVFGSISRIWTPKLLLRQRIKFVAFLSVGGVLLIVYGGVLWMFGATGTGTGAGGALQLVRQWL